MEVYFPTVPAPNSCIPLGVTVQYPTATPLPTNFVRPLVVVHSYGPSSSPLHAGQTFALEVNIINTGQIAAYNTVLTFFPGDFEPRETGGVRSEGTLQPGEIRKVIQTFTAKSDLAPGVAILDAQIRYVDSSGTAYTETVRLTLDIVKPTAVGPGGPTATPTTTVVNRPLIVIEDYEVDIEQILPGATFTLTLHARNLGTSEARNVSLIIGGGTSSGGSSGDGTPAPGGGISGGGGELSNFLPLGSSNVQFLGNVAPGNTTTANQTLIANATITPGAFSFRMSFVYVDPAGKSYTDDQVITLLVYRPLDIAVDFYRPPDPLFIGQPGSLPIQIMNLGQQSIVLGEMTVTAQGAEAMNNTMVIGPVDPGFPITFDPMLVPQAPGLLEVLVSIEYKDNFGQERVYEKILEVDVLDAPPPFDPGAEGGMDGGIDSGGFPGEPGEVPGGEETFWQMLLRFLRGLLGLDSARQPAGGFPDEGFPPGEGFPSEEEFIPPDDDFTPDEDFVPEEESRPVEELVTPEGKDPAVP